MSRTFFRTLSASLEAAPLGPGEVVDARAKPGHDEGVAPVGESAPASPGGRGWLLHLQPLLAHAGVGAQIRGRAFEDDAAVAHDVEALRDRERDGELLLDEEDGDAAPGDLRQEPADALDHL